MGDAVLELLADAPAILIGADAPTQRTVSTSSGEDSGEAAKYLV